jgi:hypothetical protein
LNYISEGGWAELPTSHFNAFVKALEEGWVRGERGWHPDFYQLTRRWSPPSWVREEIANPTPKLDAYVIRCKLLISKKVLRPFTTNSDLIPPKLIASMVDSLEKGSLAPTTEIYEMIAANLQTHPAPGLAHKAFKQVAYRMSKDSRYSDLDTANILSKMNPDDRKVFMGQLFESPEKLELIRNASWGVSDIIMDAIKSGEVWYTGTTPTPEQKSTD